MISIFVDLDGVIASFDEPFESNYGEFGKESFKKFCDDGGFLDLPLLPNAKRLIDEISRHDVNVEILSSLGNYNLKQVAEQKVIWLKKHNINWHPNFTQHKGLKKKFANLTSVLIDDKLINVADFRENGFGVHYNDARFETAAVELQDIIAMMKHERKYFIYTA